MFLSAYCIIDTKQYIYNTEIAWRRKCAQKPELKYRIIDEKHTGSRQRYDTNIILRQIQNNTNKSDVRELY